MDYVTFRRHLGKAGLKIGDFARLVGVSATAISNYAQKDAVPHTYAVLAVCFGELVDSGVSVQELLAKYGALPDNYFADPNNSGVIQFEKFKEANAFGTNNKGKGPNAKR